MFIDCVFCFVFTRTQINKIHELMLWCSVFDAANLLLFSNESNRKKIQLTVIVIQSLIYMDNSHLHRNCRAAFL